MDAGPVKVAIPYCWWRDHGAMIWQREELWEQSWPQSSKGWSQAGARLRNEPGPGTEVTTLLARVLVPEAREWHSPRVASALGVPLSCCVSSLVGWVHPPAQ